MVISNGLRIRAALVTYELDGVQYIAIASGMGGAVGGYTGTGAPWMKNARGKRAFVFRLFESNASRPFHGGGQGDQPQGEIVDVLILLTSFR
ncbi:MAG: hypothetical protein R2724_00085 [Bryobacterales bacterium]